MSGFKLDANYGGYGTPALPPITGWSSFFRAEDAIFDLPTGRITTVPNYLGDTSKDVSTNPLIPTQWAAYNASWQNGRPAVVFNSGNLLINNGGTLHTPGSPYTVFAVHQTIGATPNSSLLCSYRSVVYSQSDIVQLSPTSTRIYYDGTNSVTVGNVASLVTQPCWTLHVYKAVGTVPDFYINNVLQTITSVGVTRTLETGVAGFIIGRGATTGNFTGNIGVLPSVIDHAVSSTERTKLAAWVQAVYNI